MTHQTPLAELLTDPAVNLCKFKLLIENHRSSNHRLFERLESMAANDTLTQELYHIFAVNVAARTMMSLPEIHACCVQAALDLNSVRITYGVITGAEEGGSGKPEEVHSVLMMNALNYHGKIIFGLEPIDLKKLMAFIRLLYSCRRLKNLFRIKHKYLGIGEDLSFLALDNSTELIGICKQMCEITGGPSFHQTVIDISQINEVEHYSQNGLASLQVLEETINYCIDQLDVFVNMTPGYLQGVGFAHEGLADGMINKLFRILYVQRKKYYDEKEFLTNVYPYFAAHGNYIELFHGLVEYAEGVEVTHAQRELEKLAQLDESSLAAAWRGANDFANRNARIWDGILNIIR